MRALPFLLALAACTTAELRGDRLAEAVAGRSPEPAQSCVATDEATALRILDAHTVAYESGATVWINRLPRDCPALRADDRLAVEMHGREYCRDDRFRTISPGSALPGPVCALGDFVPYRRTQ
jgi:hypothetical protein